jgi:hypothetical protein
LAIHAQGHLALRSILFYLCSSQARPSSISRTATAPANAKVIISMDFVEGLPSLGSASAILVVVDKFSKFAHFIPLRHPFTAESVAKLFLDNVYRLHGMPLSIISDRDRVFISKFWQTYIVSAG